MKRQITGLVASLAVAAALVATAAAQQDTQKPMEVSLTGCLIQGSAPTVFVLDKAKQDPTNREEEAQSYIVINKVEDVDLTELLNHQVRVTGTPGPKPAEPEREQPDLPLFTVTAIANLADTCPAPTH